MTKIIIARHGNTFDKGDVVTRVGARTDLPLSNSGKEQAKKLGEHFTSKKLSVVAAFHSPLVRTKETAEAILSAIGSSVTPGVEEFLREIDYGVDENKPEEEVQARLGEEVYKAWENDAIVPDGWNIDPAEIGRSWEAFFKDMLEKYPEDTVLVATSGVVSRFIPYLPRELKKLKTGAYGEFSYDSLDNIKIESWNVRP